MNVHVHVLNARHVLDLLISVERDRVHVAIQLIDIAMPERIPNQTKLLLNDVFT
jgi:hypothetical protein